VILRFISILSNFDYMINIYGRFNRKLKNDKKLDVNEEILFKLFNLIFRSCKNINCDTKNRKLILKYLTSIYLSLIANFYNLNNLLDYVIKESQVFGNKLIEIIEFSYENKNDNYLCLDQLVCKLYNYYQNKYEVKNSSYCLYNFLRISVVLKKDIDYLKKDFLEKPISINNTREYFGILKIFLYSTDTDSKEIIKKIWSIYSKTIYSRIDRISSALTVVEYHYSQNRISKAKKLFSLITKNISSKNQDEAVLYLSMMQQLQFYKEYKELYESLYYQYIFNHFNKRNSTKNTLLFLENQIFLFKAKKDLEENYKFTKKLINLKYDKRIFKPGDTNTLYNNLKVGKYNCYFVSTPGQMLSAIEAQNYFKTTNNVLVILLFVIKDGKNINQMFKLSELFPYDKLITYQNKSSKFYVSFIPFLKQLTKDKVDYLFIGFNTILYRRIVANLNYKKLFYLDDGVHTITTHEDIYNDAHKNTRKEYIPFPKTLNLQKMKLIYGIHGLKVDTYLNDLNFFTVYNLEQYKNETIVKHDFSYIGSLLIKNHKINNVVYVLGQPLVNQVGVEQDIYTKYLKEVFEYYNDRKIIFVPHRLEIIYEEIETYISQRKNIEIFIPDAPIEFYFLNNSIYPRDVASFMTSALFNIRKLFPETKTRAFEIDLTKLDSHHQRGISLIYEHYRNEDVEIIELKEKYEKFISH
ncbi:MAG: hypothetical protein U9N59_13905, partial [Campylobacterota bacterium]|nr:hypothetical protein [Campylobacterota bacterium]